ncbi:bifunctional 4-hydroxy-2-oxoglutarate aldolase/2-dehydro-3-deoxy-phosphogluconate aldolase [Pontibacter sp. G13]|uniref:bifunctional 4-hydroxy-2-oxoglutarate aldolase/2-dehydro-3-deoxy-phosphogluconate aldolase n=1 Tax=Pontibacter sp. G13 TaxID=3074898 RepID=UPI00288B36F3|nr:bifunctional 4-hydroxy-2-oxoglutarate aldolase/2-dehydro-3-deoxy-phosphogluconate aldolase [Pontibacter sp. G13]WNJ20859.1 bifunctional 4-hydroxy-2-oxoglutarate aldolase/2-dehydro-3-deoxy-phosphogluconate aldolase [Pontibacter sp. G13]
MARFTRIQVAQALNETGIVPIFYHPDLEVCKKVLHAVYDAGLRVLEFTNRGDFAHEVFGALNKYAAEAMPDMILGAGSVVEPGTTSLYLQLGAAFIVSPVLNPEMAKVCNRRKVLWSPGCGSLSEINYAEELGAEIVKIFPGSQVGGPAFIKAVKGPCPWTSIMPTGGVSPTKENLSEWFSAGATCVGMGSKLIPKDMVAQGDFEALTAHITSAVQLAREVQ